MITDAPARLFHDVHALGGDEPDTADALHAKRRRESHLAPPPWPLPRRERIEAVTEGEIAADAHDELAHAVPDAAVERVEPAPQPIDPACFPMQHGERRGDAERQRGR